MNILTNWLLSLKKIFYSQEIVLLLLYVLKTNNKESFDYNFKIFIQIKNLIFKMKFISVISFL